MTRAVDAGLLAEVLDLWRQALERPELDEDADFFLHGGRSLVAARLLQRVRRLVGVRVPLDVLLSAPTPRAFTERVLELRDGSGPAN
jgi:aryl carrier-like protein